MEGTINYIFEPNVLALRYVNPEGFRDLRERLVQVEHNRGVIRVSYREVGHYGFWVLMNPVRVS